ncbi:MAG TPA: recombinase family protein [Candidatus Gemmiger faecigallinarum]|nr:recombinase family protein [Candidatus Gemmiger faecigallinarum]
MPQVHVVEPVHSHEPAKLRVCAYARVSSDSADQLNSFASQVRYYTNLISSNEDWTLVDIYADHGITGTSTAKRTEFRRMMEDCRKGKIDRILVKSLSRFARNTQDCIAALRELRRLGVTVVFEKEHINTGTMANEMLISMMSAFAQEESVSISKNMRKGVQMRMQNGTYQISRMPYGYEFGKNGEYVINEKEAEVVRYIFDQFLTGAGVDEIAKSLQAREVRRRDGSLRWYGYSIGYILKNEKYVGDELLGKRYTTDSLPFKQIPNRGESPKYHFADTHPAIISRNDFEKVQNLLKERSNKYGAGHHPLHPFTKILYCGGCGMPFYHRYHNNREEWVCCNHFGAASSCSTKTIAQTQLIDLYLKMLWKLQRNDCELLNRHLQMLSDIQSHFHNQQGKTQYMNEIAGLLEQSHTLHRLWTAGCVDSEFFYAKDNELQRAIRTKREILQRERDEEEKLLLLDVTGDILHIVETAQADRFEEDVFAATVQRITIDNAQVCFALKNGLEFYENRDENE